MGRLWGGESAKLRYSLGVTFPNIQLLQIKTIQTTNENRRKDCSLSSFPRYCVQVGTTIIAAWLYLYLFRHNNNILWWLYNIETTRDRYIIICTENQTRKIRLKNKLVAQIGRYDTIVQLMVADLIPVQIINNNKIKNKIK